MSDFLTETFEDIQFTHDKPFWTNAGRRIDFRALVKTTLLCIEIDENQSKYGGQTEEELDYEGKYIFLRFNPDKFKDEEGVVQEISMEQRIEILEDEIRTQIERIEADENERIEVINMFYDE